ncbi:hypothetical protein [Pseudonocardia sp. N23]|uniref:hypothetical protein n=1 Tax=Pseudonocardia sp. N23 TaxID=1987376 RepID=UPI000BFB99BA|nr:hypothetical protein [Pseudonocardia sp. N23]
MISAACLVATVVLGLTVGSRAGGPAFLAFVVAGYIAWRAAYKWRAWNEAIAAHKVKAAQAAFDESDRELQRRWLRQQLRDNDA